MITVVVLMKEIFVSDFIVGIDKTSTPGKIIAQYWNVPAQSGTGKSHVMALTKSIKRHCHASLPSLGVPAPRWPVGPSEPRIAPSPSGSPRFAAGYREVPAPAAQSP